MILAELKAMLGFNREAVEEPELPLGELNLDEELIAGVKGEASVTKPLVEELPLSELDGILGSEGSTNSWDMVEGGGIINGREYSQHAMERMAPDTPQVRAELSRRAEKAATQRGLQVGTQEYYEYCKKYVDPRNIPPSVIEDAISSTKGIPGNRPGTFVHETVDVKIVINSDGKVITVIPK